MKCIRCGQAEATKTWHLTEGDFEERGITSENSYRIICFCEDCRNYAEFKLLDAYLFRYWEAQQAKEQKTVTELKYPTVSEYPEGYNWFAYDKYGCAFFYQSKPRMSTDCFMYSFEERFVEATNFTVQFEVLNWKDTIQQKPAMKAAPSYYNWHPKVACVEVSQHFTSNLGQALQYIWRSNTLEQTKGQTKAEVIVDLEKAVNFINFEIARLKEL